MIKHRLLLILLSAITILSACAAPSSATPSTVIDTQAPIPQPTNTEETIALTATPTPGSVNLLPPEPRDVTFDTPQGRQIMGRYFPAAMENAPLVVLIHWVMANQDDWQTIAAWLQNRGQIASGTCSLSISCPWWDPTWFPAMEQRSYAVFTFSLSGCEANNGCEGWTGPAWAEDANSAILYASHLEGVDPSRIVTAGASIGADAAVDACAWLNKQGGAARCRGSLSFSPGGYLGLDYSQQVASLDSLQPPVPTWCLYGSDDAESRPACETAQGAAYRRLEYEGNLHGMILIQPGLMPEESNKGTLELFMEFLDLTLP